MYLFAEFHEKEQVLAAIRALKEAGSTDADLDLFPKGPLDLRRSGARPPGNNYVATVAREMPMPLIEPGVVSLRVRVPENRAAQVSELVYRAGADSIGQ